MAGMLLAAGYRLTGFGSGGEREAIEGILSIMVGDPGDVLSDILSVLRLLGRTAVNVGGARAGQVAKACNQLVVGATMRAVAGALCLAEDAGVDAWRVREAVLGGGRGQPDPGGPRRPNDLAGLPAGLPSQAVCEGFADRHVSGSIGRSRVPAFDVVARQLDQLVAACGGDLVHAAFYRLLFTVRRD